MKKISIFLFALLTLYFQLSTFNCSSQGVAINTTGNAANDKALLDINASGMSTKGGLLIPRMTTSERDAITATTTPPDPESLLIYNTDCHNFQYYDGTQWVSLNTNPNNTLGTPGAITGSNSVCANQAGITYSVAAVSEATSYSWKLPAGATITAGAGTYSITVTFGTNAGNVCVVAINNCGMSNASTLAVTLIPAVGTPNTPTPSASTICQGSSNTGYTTFATNATSYNWTVTGTGNTISGTGTTGTVTWAPGFSGTATVSVTANGCGTSSAASTTVNVTPTIGTPSTPTPSASTICQGSANTTYTTSATNATSYNWSITGTGNTISGTGTTGTVTWNAAFSGTATISVTATGCGTSSAASTTVTVNPLPATPTATAATAVGSTRITANWNTVSGATSYLLDVSTVSNFASFAGTYNGLNVGAVLTYNITGLSSGTAYYYRIKAVNSCGNGSSSNTITSTTMNIALNLVSYWKLDEANGNATDAVGLNTLTNNGTATYSTGEISNGVNFNGTNQWLGKASPTGLPTGSGACSMSLWYKSSSPSGIYLVDFGTAACTGYHLALKIDDATHYSVDIGCVATAIAVSTIATNTWYHVVLTYPGSGTTYTLYHNGSILGAVTLSATPILGSTYVSLGAYNNSSTYLHTVSFDEVGIWSRALTATEVTTLYNSGAGLQYPF
ncbi:MAG: LamG domain-containing protein [Bacteroidetes bacterium]|nr:LamG domain-containing protein [Bacteroidota bacterium]